MNERQQFAHGIELFNTGKFFEAHEAWEGLWLVVSGEEKTFLQGMIQVAAAFHHHGRQNLAGTESLLAAGLAKLTDLPGIFQGIDLAKLRRDAKAWSESRGENRESEAGKYPQIESAPRTNQENGRSG
jgi:uncharacterized protein